MARMQDYELDAWLGSNWTDEQREKIRADWQDYETSGLAGDEGLDAAVLTAIAQHHDRVLEIPHADTVKAAVIVSCRYGGISESEAQRRSGRDRGTVRRWLGK